MFIYSLDERATCAFEPDSEAVERADRRRWHHLINGSLP
jgi:hypothetical protein